MPLLDRLIVGFFKYFCLPNLKILFAEEIFGIFLQVFYLHNTKLNYVSNVQALNYPKNVENLEEKNQVLFISFHSCSNNSFVFFIYRDASTLLCTFSVK